MTEPVKTMDGSYTLKSERFGQFYHSFTGAVEESELKYVAPCDIRERAKKGSLKILDVCFGIGYNSAAAIDAALEANPKCKIEVVALEIDEELLNSMQKMNPPLKSYAWIKGLKNKLEFKEGNVKLKLYLGDANETIKKCKDDYFDCVFFDPFSPATNPEMWSASLLGAVRDKMGSGSILATYSCARMVRENLKSAGFTAVLDGPKVHRRGPGTLALP
ncbi:MAG: tRNA (5-methylaminomethyl-2-thiouridine)(34)-methyltransferase MnmD [Candidatus Nanoarchaeia archaeon]